MYDLLTPHRELPYKECNEGVAEFDGVSGILPSNEITRTHLERRHYSILILDIYSL